jgi:nucleotide-binding universal stress UspA family protein
MVAFDGSPEAELALAHACAIAQACLARLTLVGVLAPPALLAWQHSGGTQRALPGADLQERLKAAANDVPDHLRATTLLLEGDPARELLHAVREHDVLFMGPGRVTDDVVREADVPVVVVHRPGGPDLAA